MIATIRGVLRSLSRPAIEASSASNLSTALLLLLLLLLLLWRRSVREYVREVEKS